MGISSFCVYDLWAPVKCCWRDVLSEVMGYERMLLWRKFSINCVHPTSAKDFCLEKHQLLPWLFSFYRVFPNHKGFQSNDHLGYIAPIMWHRSNIGYCIFLQHSFQIEIWIKEKLTRTRGSFSSLLLPFSWTECRQQRGINSKNFQIVGFSSKPFKEIAQVKKLFL